MIQFSDVSSELVPAMDPKTGMIKRRLDDARDSASGQACPSRVP